MYLVGREKPVPVPVIVTYIYIFFSRIFDVSLGALRIIYLTRGRSKLAAAIGFFEVMIYVVALSMVVGNLHHPLCVLIYGLGFAAGNLVGSFIEEKVAVGFVTAQVVTVQDGRELDRSLREHGYGVTAMECYGRDGTHRILHIFMKRRDLPSFLKLLSTLDRQAVVSIFDTRKIMGGYFARIKDK